MEVFNNNDCEDGADTGQTRCLYVLSDVDGYKYKLVVQGEVRRLTVERIKKYLHKTTGIVPQQQLLTFNGVTLGDKFTGKEAGLFDGAILRLQQRAPNYHRNHSSGGGAYLCEDSPDAGLVQPSSASIPTVTMAASSATHSPPPLQFSYLENQQDGRKGAYKDSAQLRVPPRSMPAAFSLPSSSCSQPSIEHGPQEPLPSTEIIGPIQGTTQTASPEPQAYRREMEAKIAALSIENVRLREQLQVVARQAANASTDWKQQEEVARLKTALTAAEKNIAEADRAAAQRWRIKEEELVKELDLLREERRRVQEDSTCQEAKLQALLRSMEGEIRSLQYQLHDKDDTLRSTQLALVGLQNQLNQREASGSHDNGRMLKDSHEEETAGTHRVPPHSIDVLTEEALSHLSYFLSTPTPLQLDPANDTCIVPVSDTLNLLITLDRETEHLYLYVTLLNELPSSPVERLRLYEMLLQGALLGKDVAGGGVGLSAESNLILMSTSADLRHNGALSLAAAAPSFVESAMMWEEKLSAIFS